MESLSPTAYVILGLVRKEPRSGYEIKSIVDNTTRFFWAASYGQIYPELKRLAEAGLVVGADAPTGGRRRTVYEITADGEEELVAWLRQPPTTFEMREEGLLKLFFAGALPRDEAVEILRAMRAHRLAANAQLRAMEAGAAEKEDQFPLLVLRGGLEFTEWFAEWCERMEEQILAAEPAGAEKEEQPCSTPSPASPTATPAGSGCSRSSSSSSPARSAAASPSGSTPTGPTTPRPRPWSPRNGCRMPDCARPR